MSRGRLRPRRLGLRRAEEQEENAEVGMRNAEKKGIGRWEDEKVGNVRLEFVSS